MGGRGASSGISKKRNVYGSQFHAVKDSNGKALVSGNVKFIQSNSRDSESLMETMTKGRVYALTGGDDLIKIVYFDKENKHVKEINFGHKHAGLDPHVHHGYFHNENDGKKGATRLTKEEKKMVEALKKYGMLILAEDSLGWQNRLIDKASVQFRLTAKNLGALKGSFFMLLKMVN